MARRCVELVACYRIAPSSAVLDLYELGWIALCNRRASLSHPSYSEAVRVGS